MRKRRKTQKLDEEKAMEFDLTEIAEMIRDDLVELQEAKLIPEAAYQVRTARRIRGYDKIIITPVEPSFKPIILKSVSRYIGRAWHQHAQQWGLNFIPEIKG